MAITSLSIIWVFFPFDQIQVSAQQQENNNSNTPKLSLPTVSTAVGTGAAASVAGEAINKNQYKMLDDRIIEYLNKINNLG